MTDEFDAVVIGGGPAGSMSALLLAKRRWRVALIERGGRFRDKACGHCLNLAVHPLLQREGLLDDVRARSVGRSQRLRVHLPKREPATIALGDGHRAGGYLLVPRREFDQLLRDRAARAGATVVQSACACLRSTDEHGAVVEVRSPPRQARRLHCRLVIGADGLRSGVARAAGLAATKRIGRKFGFALDVRCPRADLLAPDTIEMFVVPGGYLGVVNQGRGLLHLAGLVSPPDADASRPVSFVATIARRFDLLRRVGLANAAAAQVAKVLGAGPIPCRPRAVAAGRVALVGDAAGYVEPFTGEGMSWALTSAEVLAEVVADQAPGDWTPAAARRYRRAWRDRIGRRQWLCRAVAWSLQRPLILGVLAGAVARPGPLTRGLLGKVVMP
ncbi:MAG: NAD(P)/FAD-dependent oxidoreductase [Phycisphaerales bacterium]